MNQWLIFLFLVSQGWAETLEILALEVHEKFVKPTYENTVGVDQAVIDKTITRLRGMTKGGKVSELLHLKMEKSATLNSARDESMKRVGPSGSSRQVEVGHEVSWASSTSGNRTIKLNYIGKTKRWNSIYLNVVHSLGPNWMCSSALTSSNSTIFIFERILETAPVPEKTRWIVTSLSSEQPKELSSDGVASRIADRKVVMTVIAPIPSGSLGNTFIVRSRPFTNKAATESPTEVQISIYGQRESQIIKGGFPPSVSLDFDRVDARSGMNLTRHLGKWQTVPKNSYSMNSEKVTVRDVTRIKNGTKSTSLKKKGPEYYLDAFISEK